MEKAYALLGIDEYASIGEIEEAYRNKKRLYDPSRFVDGSLDWQFACTRNNALDDAYKYAVTMAENHPTRSGSEFEDEDDWDDEEPSLLGELIGLVFVCPIAAYLVQLTAPTVLSELAYGSFRRTMWLFNITALFFGYLFPLLTRFVILKRPVEKFLTVLLLFPLTLLSVDLFTSLILKFSRMSDSGSYVPVLYLAGLGPLFILLYAHNSILAMRFESPRTSAPFFKRLTAYTFTLALSVALSMFLCAALNREPPNKTMSAHASSPAEEKWRTLELLDAGAIEIPDAWEVEYSDGKLTEARYDSSVQYVRDALSARPYGRRGEAGVDFSLEVFVYWWTDHSGRVIPAPGEIVDKIQDHQLDAIKEAYPDIALDTKEEIEREDRIVSVLTVETDSIPGLVVRFKNLVFEYGNKIYSLTVGYPAHEERVWMENLEQILSRWRLRR